MRLYFIFTFLAVTQVFAIGKAQTITFKAQGAPLQTIFQVIRDQTGFKLIGERDILKDTNPVTVEANNMPLKDFLDVALEGHPIRYVISENNIILMPKPMQQEENFITPPEIKPQLITGQIIDPDGKPVAAVSIVNKTSGKGTATSSTGWFSIEANENDIIEITSVGYDGLKLTYRNNQLYLLSTQSKKFHDKDGIPATNAIIRLNISVSDLDEVQVVAYGKTTKRFSTGNVVTVKSKEIERQPLMNPIKALQGRVPGLFIQALSTQSSSPVKVEIRGKNSLNPLALSEPLFVIDGIPQTTLTIPGATESFPGVSPGVVQSGYSFTGGQSILFSLNSKDIESISVLKDADATAIYGSRAANGVILITTKKGTPGRSSFNLNLEEGVVMVPRYPRLLNLEQYLSMRREAFKNDGITPTIQNAPDLLLWDTTQSTNWFHELASPGHHTSAMASFSGGDLRTNFRLSGSYRNKVDLHARSGSNDVATVSLSTNHSSANQKLNVSIITNYAYTKVDVIQNSPDKFMLPPNAPPIFNEVGKLNYAAWQPATEAFFPFSYILAPNISRTNTLNSSISLRYSILKGLSVSASGRFSKNDNSNDVYLPIAAQNPLWNPSGMAIFGNTSIKNIAFEPEINYVNTIGKGRLNILIGGTFQSASSKGTTTTGMGYSNDELIKNLNNAPYKTVSEGYSEYRYAALFGRINYIWDSKYIFNLNARRDGSSRFAPGKQFGNFGSVGLGWIASEENWLKNLLPSWISFLKLRGSYGLTGSDNIDDYQYISRYSSLTPSGEPLYTYNGIQPYVPIIPFNQKYQWESLKSFEGALNVGFVNDRVNLEVAWYQKRSGNQLTKVPTPIYTGFPKVTANWDATVQNKGIEASITAQVIETKNLKANLMFNISRNTNKLISYPDLEHSPYATTYKVGQSLSMEHHFNLLGVDPLTGSYVFEDYNKDGRVTSDASLFPGTGVDDRYVTADMAPRFQGGLGGDVQWKDFELSFDFYFINQLGQHPSYALQSVGLMNIIYSDAVLNDHWKKPGDVSKYAKFSTRSTSDVFAPVDASFLRLNNLAFSYNFPETFARKLKMQNATVSLRAQNVFTITAYKAEPEIRGGSLLPIPRVAIVALSFTF